MLRRAFFFVVFALVAALVAGSGWLESKQAWVWGACYASLGWAVLSLMLSLFEEETVEEPEQRLTSSPAQSPQAAYLIDLRGHHAAVLNKARAGSPS